jgi:hypothetical protein
MLLSKRGVVTRDGQKFLRVCRSCDTSLQQKGGCKPKRSIANRFVIGETPQRIRDLQLTATEIALITPVYTSAMFVTLSLDGERKMPNGQKGMKGHVLSQRLDVQSAVSQLPRITWWLWPIPVVLFVIYPYTKRFTWACHLVLGVSIGIAPIGGWIAVTGAFAWAPVLLWAAVAVWIGGFDVIYALLDVESDRVEGINSVPVRFGEVGALRIAAACHVLTVVLLVLAGVAASVTWPYYAGIAVCAAILAWEHLHVRPGDVGRINAAFGNANMVMSLVFFVGVVVEVAVA